MCYQPACPGYRTNRKHTCGIDDPFNINCVTAAQHAEEHKILYWLYGHEEDRIAWQMLDGQITAEEAIRQAGIAANLGQKRTPLHKARISQSNKGKQAGEKHPMFNKHHSKEAKAKMSMASKRVLATGKPVGMTGKKHSQSTREWIKSRPRVGGKFIKVAV